MGFEVLGQTRELNETNEFQLAWWSCFSLLEEEITRRRLITYSIQNVPLLANYYL